MKYIIELPKEVKEKFDNATKDDIYGSYYDYNSVIGNAIKNGTPLEAIKTDVHRHKMHFYPSDYTFINTLIDKWINKGIEE